jgi:hypothetical protein
MLSILAVYDYQNGPLQFVDIVSVCDIYSPLADIMCKIWLL